MNCGGRMMTAARPLELLNDKLKLSKDNLRKRRHIMKRCFMTGKQCIFSSQIQSNLKTRFYNESRDKNDGNLDIEPLIFFITPFRSNLKAFYDWSLKPYLIWDYDISEEAIQCADDVREIGYIVCEKICRKIQESDLVIAEISLKNPNVFYEIGLACGLEHPIVFMQNETSDENIIDNYISISKTLMVNDEIDDFKDCVLLYPGVNPLNVEKYKLENYVITPSIPKKRTSKLRIIALSFESNQAIRDSKAKDDIEINFTRLFSGAVTVAMNEIKKEVDKKPTEKRESWEKTIYKLGEPENGNEWEDFSRVITIEISDTIYSKGTFTEVAREIEESFCTIIDVSQNDPIAYFWLGYCHARGLNAIPVNQVDAQNIHLKGKSGVESKLAFDIRALWYVEYKHNEPNEFKNKIKEVLRYLLERDIPDRHRRAFWDRFSPEHKIRVFTGAIHSKDHYREMVGDWDVRTVSELFSYLPSIRNSETIELFNPLYSPDWAYCSAHLYKKDGGDDKPINRNDFIEEFRNYIKSQLDDVNAIVIASPDVNPLTEYILNKIYKVKFGSDSIKEQSNNLCEPFDGPYEKLAFNGYILTKGVKEKAKKSALVEDDCKDYTKFHRIFYKEMNAQEPNISIRGFTPHCGTCEGDALLETYIGQYELESEFSLLGHLLVARYPPTPESDNLVVLLNGVSGPATFALAEILTGGGIHTNPDKKSDSEEMLRKINEVLDKPKCIGVEAIVVVKIRRSKDKASENETAEDKKPKHMTYVDSREVVSWKYYEGHEPKEIGSCLYY